MSCAGSRPCRRRCTGRGCRGRPARRGTPGCSRSRRELDRLVAHELRREVRGGLRHRVSRAGASRPGRPRGPRCTVAAGRLELHRHVGELPLEALELGEATPTSRSVHVPAPRTRARPARAHAHGGVAAPLVVEVGEQRLERLAVAGSPREQDVISRDVDVIEPARPRSCPGGPSSVRPGAPTPSASQVDDHRTDALAPSPRKRPNQAPRRLVPARDVVLVGVQSIARPVLGEPGGMWFTADPASVSVIPMQNIASPDPQRKPPVLQRVAAEVLDGRDGPL